MNPTLKVSVTISTILCVLFLFSSNSNYLVSAQDAHNIYEFPCYTVINNAFYNLTSLQGNEITGSDDYYNYYYDFCQVSPHCKEDGSMACQIPKNDPNTIYDIAWPNDDILPHVWDVIQNPAGIQLTAFGSGTYCNKSSDYRRTIIHVLCDQNQITAPTTVIGNVTEGPACTYTFVIKHVSGCALPVPPTSAPAGSGDSNGVTGAGFGVGFVIGLVVCVAAVGGYVYYQKHRAGGHENQFKKVGTNSGDDDKSVYLTAPPHGARTDDM